MNNLKIFILLILVCLCFAPIKTNAAEKPFVVVATTFPVYLFTANICADAENVKVEQLIPSAAGCPHDFALRPGDLRKLALANVLVINGAHLEDFLDKVIKESKFTVINASDGIQLLPEDNYHDHGHAGHAADGNPHTFAAPAEASLMVANIAANLAKLNPENAAIYNSNKEKYGQELAELSSKFAAIGAKAKNKGIVLEHSAIAYMAANAGLDILDVFENGASAGRLNKLKKFLLTSKPALLAGDSQYPDRLLRTLSTETGIPFARLNPCSSGPDNAPLDYYQQVMAENLKVLEAHFGQ